MLIVSLLFCYVAINYFSGPEFVVKKIDRVNIIYSAPFFIAGGLIYLWREKIYNFVSSHLFLSLAAAVVITVAKFALFKGGATFVYNS